MEESRPFELVLVSLDEEAMGEGRNFKDENIVLRGFVTLFASDSEKVIKSKLEKAINTEFPIVNGKDLVFLKADRRKLDKVVNTDGFDYRQIRLLAGQGAIYVKLKDGYNFMLEHTSFSDEDEDGVKEAESESQGKGHELPASSGSVDGVIQDNKPKETEESYQAKLDKDVQDCIKFCEENSISDPVEILRQMQKFIVQGRQLEITSESDSLKGETNLVFINRRDVLQSIKEEFETISSPRLALEVKFYEEGAEDYGGPRKEFLSISINAFKTKYFADGWRNHIAKEYEIVGLVIAISVLQNGLLPRFFSEEMLGDVFNNNETSNPCIANLRKGLDKIGLFRFVTTLPALKFLFHDSETYAITIRRLLFLLEPVFSELGSNSRMFEEKTYGLFIKYARDVAGGGRDKLNLGNILQFATCLPEEPLLGFSIKPSIHFQEADSAVKWSFLPTSNTCINKMYIPRPTTDIELPPEDDLFEVYDNAFLNQHFGRR